MAIRKNLYSFFDNNQKTLFVNDKSVHSSFTSGNLKNLLRNKKRKIKKIVVMAAGSMDGIFRNIFEGCISSCDSSIQRRPYHKNCGCALHERSRGGGSATPCRHGRSEVIMFPIQRSWTEGNSLALHLASSSSSSNLQSISSSSSISTLASLSSTVSDIDSPI